MFSSALFCLLVGLSVSNITQKSYGRFLMKFQELS